MFYDQQTDTDFTVLHSILQKVANDTLVTTLKGISIDYDGFTKVASNMFAWESHRMFPVDTAENTILSKLYFDEQAPLLTEKTATEHIARRLDTFLELYGVPDVLFSYKPVEKVASTSPVKYALLPEHGVSVSNAAELVKIGSLFSRDKARLAIPDRVEFSRNFIKAAKDLGVTDYPTDVAKYAAQLDTDLANTRYLLQMRSTLAQRMGNPGTEYTKLAEQLDTLSMEASNDVLEKLAETIYLLDKKNGFDHTRYDRHIPCAYASVFNKQAEDTSNVTLSDEERELSDLKSMSKADIIGKYGEGALDTVEEKDGEIDYDALAEIVRKVKNIEGPSKKD